MGNKNANLNAAKTAKQDEWYTQEIDIINELQHYKHHFENKIVYCNCDNPVWSNFWKYFYDNFYELKLKKLISTYYQTEGQVYKTEYDGSDVVKTPLVGNGDFRSEECVEILREADICCTNPPFSLWRQFCMQLIEYEKKFLIIGNKNVISCKEIFPLLKENKMWIGYCAPSEFRTPDGEITKSLAGLTRWFANLDINKRHKDLVLLKCYSKEEYPEYDNCKAIEVGKVSDIPCDYDGVMGVPITFLDKYNPSQFEVIGKSDDFAGPMIIDGKRKENPGRFYVNGKRKFDRILIQRKKEGE